MVWGGPRELKDGGGARDWRGGPRRCTGGRGGGGEVEQRRGGMFRGTSEQPNGSGLIQDDANGKNLGKELIGVRKRYRRRFEDGKGWKADGGTRPRGGARRMTPRRRGVGASASGKMRGSAKMGRPGAPLWLLSLAGSHGTRDDDNGGQGGNGVVGRGGETTREMGGARVFIVERGRFGRHGRAGWRLADEQQRQFVGGANTAMAWMQGRGEGGGSDGENQIAGAGGLARAGAVKVGAASWRWRLRLCLRALAAKEWRHGVVAWEGKREERTVERGALPCRFGRRRWERECSASRIWMDAGGAAWARAAELAAGSGAER
uniref:Uncharacterized protein n=1 Tax=Oryza sativa subsp. japonica TaxID=39947 RepID=Q75K64_ORYSJ|nr:hypothetical protein [Oryza sativa Japonica Group]